MKSKVIKYVLVGLQSSCFRWVELGRYDEKPENHGFNPALYFQFKCFPVFDNRDYLESMNKELIKIENKVDSINTLIDIFEQYAPIYKNWFDENYTNVKFKQDGSFHKKFSDSLKALARPSDCHRFHCDEKAWLTVSLWSGSGYVEHCISLYNTYHPAPIELNIGLEKMTCFQYLDYLKQLDDLDTLIRQKQSEIVAIKNKVFK